MEYKIVEQEVNGVKFKRKYVDKFVVTEVEPNFDEPQESMYAVVLSSLITDQRFTPAEKIVILEISALSRKNGYCYATKGYIAKATGASFRTIENTLRKMEKYQMAERIYTNKLEDKDGKEHVGTYQRIYWRQPPFEGGITQNYQEGVGEKVLEGVGQNYQDKTEYKKQSITTDIYKEEHSSKEKKENKLQGGTSDNDLLNLVALYNNLFQKNVRSLNGFEANFQYWKGIHPIDKMGKALRNARADKFWRDKMTLAILFRKKNPRGENVDYIEDLSQRGQPVSGVNILN